MAKNRLDYRFRHCGIFNGAFYDPAGIVITFPSPPRGRGIG